MKQRMKKMAEPQKTTNQTPETETTKQPSEEVKTAEVVEPTKVVEEDNSLSTELPEFGKEQIADFLKADEDEEDGIDDVAEVEKPVEGDKDAEGKKKPDEVKPPEKEPVVAAVPAGETAPVVEPKKEDELKPAAEAAPEQVKPITPTEPEPVVAPVPALSAEEQTEAYNTWRGEVETELAEGRYALSTEEAEELDVSPEIAKAFSRNSARVYMDALTGAIGHMTKALPQLLEVALTTRESTGKAETDFYAAWPKLNTPESAEVVHRLGVAYRQQNPTVSKTDFIRDVGAAAHIALKLPVDEAVAIAPASEETPTAPAQPFTPAGTGSPSSGVGTDKNPFTALNETFDLQEEELDVQ